VGSRQLEQSRPGCSASKAGGFCTPFGSSLLGSTLPKRVQRFQRNGAVFSELLSLCARRNQC
jgi:hypothetical protein